MNENTAAMIQTFIPMVLILVVFYFFLIRPQKKREKETQEMRNSLEVGDEIVTVHYRDRCFDAGRSSCNRDWIGPQQNPDHPLGCSDE